MNVIRYGMLALVLCGPGQPVFAQSEPQAPSETPASGGVQIFPRYDFHMTAEHLSHDDPRYVWDTNYGGELDLVGFGSTRLTFVANYQAMLGEEFQSFDPTQGNYILAGYLTTVIRGVEMGPVFYHQSRHLSDRAKSFPVDWNMWGGRLARHIEKEAGTVDLRLDLRRTVQKTYVDYNWELDAGGRGQYRVHRNVALIGGGFLRRLTVDGSRGRGSQTGGRVDGGIRIDGPNGAVELFLGIERRIDPYLLEFGTETWTSVGMRLLSR